LSGRTLSSLRARLAFSLPPDPALALSACILFTLAGCRGLLPAHGGGAPPSRALDARTACHLLGLLTRRIATGLPVFRRTGMRPGCENALHVLRHLHRERHLVGRTCLDGSSKSGSTRPQSKLRPYGLRCA